MIGTSLTRYRDFGLLLLRVSLGLALVVHGWPKLSGGPGAWEGIGRMGGFGQLYPTFWGLAAALTEFGGGILLAVGFAFRPVCALLFIQMMVALSTHLHRHDGFGVYSHAVEDGVVFLSLLFVGPGKFSVDGK